MYSTSSRSHFVSDPHKESWLFKNESLAPTKLIVPPISFFCLTERPQQLNNLNRCVPSTKIIWSRYEKFGSLAHLPFELE